MRVTFTSETIRCDVFVKAHCAVGTYASLSSTITEKETLNRNKSSVDRCWLVQFWCVTCFCCSAKQQENVAGVCTFDAFLLDCFGTSLICKKNCA